MFGTRKQKLVAGTIAALTVAGGGAALASTQLGSPQEESQAVVNDAAKQLGVTPTALSNALKKALENRVDAAVAAGRLTKAEGDALKSRIASGEVPFLGGPFHGPFVHVGLFGPLKDAASYLGLTPAQLRTQLESGKTLAQIAKDKGKSVDGLVQALVDSAKTRLDAAVKAGRLTSDQEASILAELKEHVTDLVNGTGRLHFGPGRLGAPPPLGGPGF